jgi:hypothetical protein
MKAKLALPILSSVLFACSSGPCLNKAGSHATASTKVAGTEKPQLDEKPSEKNRALLTTAEVAVPDGSRQCEPGSGQSSDVFKEKLLKANIKVLSVSSKPDGLMRIQKCGAPTGQHFVFKIYAVDVESALSLGFIRWEW